MKTFYIIAGFAVFAAAEFQSHLNYTILVEPINVNLTDIDFPLTIINTTGSRIGRKGLLELRLNPYDPISRIANQLWDHLFSRDYGKLRFPFNKPVTVTTSRPIVSTTPRHSFNWAMSTPAFTKPTPTQTENSTTMTSENPTMKPEETTPSVKPPPPTMLPTLPAQTIPPPQAPGGGTPQQPVYPPPVSGGPSQGGQLQPGGVQQGPGGPSQGPGGHPQGPGNRPPGPGGHQGQFPGHGPHPGQQQPPGYPQQPGQFNPNQQMPPVVHPGGPFLIDGKFHQESLGFAHPNLQLHLIHNSPSLSGSTNVHSADDAVSLGMPDEYETEDYEKNEVFQHIFRPSFQKNKTAQQLTRENSDVSSTKTKQGIMFHITSSGNPMKSQLQFYLSPDFSLFIKPSLIQSQYGMKKKSSSSSKLGRPFMSHQKEIEFSSTPSESEAEKVHENVPEAFLENPGTDKLPDNLTPTVSDSIVGGIAYLIEMISKLASITQNVQSGFPENNDTTTIEAEPSKPINESRLNDKNPEEIVIEAEANTTKNISTTLSPDEPPLVNETSPTDNSSEEEDLINQTTEYDQEMQGNQSQIFSTTDIDDNENLISSNTEAETTGKPEGYYSIIGPKNITYIEVDANGKFRK